MAFLGIAPTGTVLPFAGSTAPEGWALCNGSAINRTTYSKLFSVISTTYGTGDGSTTFNVPDMRGVYPRGAGTNGTTDYGGATSHTPAGGALGNKGRQLTAKNNLSTTVTAAGGTASLTGTTSFTVGHTHPLSNNGGAAIKIFGNTGVGFSDFYNTADGPSVSIGKVGDNSGGSNNTATITTNVTRLVGNTDTTAANGTVGISSTAASISTNTISSTDTETTPAFLALNYIIKL